MMNIAHTALKLGRALKMLGILFLARMFGQYVHSAWDGFHYARYRWRGREYAFPTSAFDEPEAKQ